MPSFDSVIVRFIIQHNTRYGEDLRICGSNEKLGKWDPQKAPYLSYGNGGVWSLELVFKRDEVPFEFKYLVTRVVKVKKTVATLEPGTTEPYETEQEVEELQALWEQTPNRVVKGDKAKIQLKDKWEKLPQTEAEIAFEERNSLLNDINALETFTFPYFVSFPKRMGSHEFAVGIFGEPDKTTLKGQTKDKSRSTFMEGILRKNNEGRYQLFWFGKQTFASNVLGEKKYDVSELLPFEAKNVTFDDRTAAEISEVVKPTSQSTEDLEETIQLSLGSIDWPRTFHTVIGNLGGDGLQTNDGIQWEPLGKKWLFVPKFSSTRKQRKSVDLDTPVAVKPPPSSVRVHSADKTRGTLAFQWIPGTTDILAIKTTSFGDDAFTYVTAYNKEGTRIMNESYVGPFKYEGSIIVKDLDCFPTEPFVISSECDTSDLRRREQETREHIEGAQIKYTILKEQELSDQASSK